MAGPPKNPNPGSGGAPRGVKPNGEVCARREKTGSRRANAGTNVSRTLGSGTTAANAVGWFPLVKNNARSFRSVSPTNRKLTNPAVSIICWRRWFWA